MKTIWKFPLEVPDEQVLMVPKGAKPLTVQLQAGVPCLWCEVDSAQNYTRLNIFIYGTGDTVKEGAQYIGTYQTMGGELIWHVYAAFEISYS